MIWQQQKKTLGSIPKSFNICLALCSMVIADNDLLVFLPIVLTRVGDGWWMVWAEGGRMWSGGGRPRVKVWLLNSDHFDPAMMLRDDFDGDGDIRRIAKVLTWSLSRPAQGLALPFWQVSCSLLFLGFPMRRVIKAEISLLHKNGLEGHLAQCAYIPQIRGFPSFQLEMDPSHRNFSVSYILDTMMSI